MKTFWVIQADTGKDLVAMTDRMQEMMIPYVGCQLIPFSSDIEYLNFPPSEDHYVIPYGTTKLIALGQELGWEGIFYNEDTFSVDAWVKNRTDMLNQDVEILTASNVEKLFQGWPDPNEYYFIRPVADFKAFKGMVLSALELAGFLSNKNTGTSFGSETFVQSAKFTADTLCAVSPAQNIDAEYRFFVVDRKVVSGSRYQLNHNLSLKQTDADMNMLAQQLANQWLPHETCVMDIAVGEFGMKVIEFNTFNASGFYDHNIPAIVDAVTLYGLKCAMNS